MPEDPQAGRPVSIIVTDVEAKLNRRIVRCEALYGDVSARRFFRLHLEDDSLVLMVYPEEDRARMDRDATMMSSFAYAGLGPALIARGSVWFIVQDAGPRDLADHLKTLPPEGRIDGVRRCLDLIPRIQSLPGEITALNPPLDAGLFRGELDHTLRWYVEAHLGVKRTDEVREFFDSIAREAGTFRRAFCHRDYHANNILVEESRSILLVDVQDARPGPRFYDAVSLVNERAAATIPREDREELLRYAAVDLLHLEVTEAIQREILMTSLQRCLKALGTFARQVAAGRETYRPHLERGRMILRELLGALNIDSVSNNLM